MDRDHITTIVGELRRCHEIISDRYDNEPTTYSLAADLIEEQAREIEELTHPVHIIEGEPHAE